MVLVVVHLPSSNDSTIDFDLHSLKSAADFSLAKCRLEPIASFTVFELVFWIETVYMVAFAVDNGDEMFFEKGNSLGGLVTSPRYRTIRY
jgi:hypothetical protein